MADFYSSVPKTLRENLEWRMTLRKKAAKDAGLRRAIMTACKHDVLYWLNGWCWLHEPRPRFDENGRLLQKVFPFITWEHQDEAFVKIRAALGVKNIGVEKCRGEGLTWFACMAALQDLLFGDNISVGMVSSKEDLSDSPNIGSLMGKIDWEMTRLPTWMTGLRGRDRNSGDWYRNTSDHSLINLRRGNHITAFAASPDTGRGDRFTWFDLDEHGSDDWKKENKDERVLEALGGTTDSILYISTPKGAFGAFHRLMHSPNGDLKIYIDWRQNPSKNRGLYRITNGVPFAVDPEGNPLPSHYNPPAKEVVDLLSRLRKNGYDLESKTRSPWLDRECDRGSSTPQNVAQEIERDYGGSVTRIFGDYFMQAAEEHIRAPDACGNFSVFDDLDYSFDRTPNGVLKLWCQLDIHGNPPNHQYAVGVDVASGGGGAFCSNSVIIVMDLQTKEQVAEYATNIEQPTTLADRAIAICKWFNNAYLGWEHGGPGAQFTSQVIDQGYTNCYKRRTKDKSTKKVSEKLGFVNKGDAREALFGDTERLIRQREVVVHSQPLVDEFAQYIRDGKKIIHSSNQSDDATHGDRVIAVGVAIQAMLDRPTHFRVGDKKAIDTEPVPGTLAYREWMFNQHNNDASDNWDDRSTADFRGASKEHAHF
jgi:hypothetical protein